MSARKIFFFLLILFIITGFLTIGHSVYWGIFLVLTTPLIIIGLWDISQKKHAIRRNFPIVGHFRYLLESIRPEINQYFVESNSNGVPFSREGRSLVYQRAKKQLDTLPFGTQIDVYEKGYEYLAHSMYPGHFELSDLRTRIGNYDCSIINISAMSFGSLSTRAIQSLNQAAKLGKFAHNTGEGGISPYHKEGGDLIWQIGTGYFGCRTPEGQFCEKKFEKVASLDQVKMIEIKISQGAKPGHGGILPKEKLTEEIAEIRGVPMGQDVLSPPGHSAFDNSKELLEFIVKLKKLCQKPVGIKLCLGRRAEFLELCHSMLSNAITPDFIAIDGGEGGTGAAPLEFSNHLGQPGLDSLVFVDRVLTQIGLRDQLKLISSGKIISGFDVIKRLALGADAIYMARSMMLALGCIQALRCNSNACPAGVATQDPDLVVGLDVPSKAERVFNYHHETLESTAHLLGAMGISKIDQLHPGLIKKRVDLLKVISYRELIDQNAQFNFKINSETTRLGELWGMIQSGQWAKQAQ